MLAERCLQQIKVFNRDTNVIGDTFSKASKHYRKYSELQDRCSNKLKNAIELSGQILDLGAGPGTHYNTAAKNVVCVDIALGMLKELQTNFPDYKAINGDAAKLPLQGESVDSVISNLALQWCDDFSAVTAELHRILKPEGEVAISLVAANSLPELSKLGLKANQFNTVSEFQAAFENNFWSELECQVRREIIYFDDLKSLLYSIKGVGASAIKAVEQNHQNQSLKGKKHWFRLVEQAELLRTDKGLPLTYNIVQIKAKKLG
ncbi:methyltransferase domain-containing protein [Shewanella sp. 202IG2-18]|uniref:methyltransferase domain-containing protein n=1 Tax=Parashewanella hymeniacidonis TaxID=2807618 RepID=UPI001961BD4D|nr:methyltransferase domain-containing protein [Parashewanella hymeniacidonis]MBM7070567.1 methyltransferase domain-containing protein [Parashewanella hymeniacidonis]